MSEANPFKPTGAPRGKPFPRGVKNPGHGKGRNGGGRQKGTPNKIPVPFKQWILQFLEREDYRKTLEKRLLEGQAPTLEILAAHWHGGKPKETHEIKSESLDKLYAIACSQGLVSQKEQRERGGDDEAAD